MAALNSSKNVKYDLAISATPSWIAVHRSARTKTRKLPQVYWHLATDLLSTSRYQDAFAWLLTDLLQVDWQNLLSIGLLQVVSTSSNKFANDKLEQAWIKQTCSTLMKLTSLLQLVDKLQQFCGVLGCIEHHFKPVSSKEYSAQEKILR